jgi:hypothetical protein
MSRRQMVSIASASASVREGFISVMIDCAHFQQTIFFFYGRVGNFFLAGFSSI